MNRRVRFGAGLTLFVLLLSAIIYLADQPRRRWAEAARAESQAAPKTVGLAGSPVPASLDGRQVFPFSIIQGGAHSVGELKEAIAADPVVAAHYANFDLANTRVVTLAAPRLAHVSYRIGDAVYWTRKQLVLRAGEKVLTDGVHMARTRCGNQLAELPGEVSAFEPPAAFMDTPLAGAAGRTPQLVAGLPIPLVTGGPGFLTMPGRALPVLAGVIPAGGSPGDPIVHDPPFDGPLFPPGHPGVPPGDPGLPPGPPPPTNSVTPRDPPGGDIPPPVQVPEPGTGLLTLGAAAAYGAKRLKRMAAERAESRVARRGTRDVP